MRMFGQLLAGYLTNVDRWRMSIVRQKRLRAIEYSRRQN